MCRYLHDRMPTKGFALTGAGRRRIRARGRAPGTILSFRKRDVLGSGVQHRKPARGNLKE